MTKKNRKKDEIDIEDPEVSYYDNLIKRLESPIKELVLIGNYIENVIGIKPVSALRYRIYYNNLYAGGKNHLTSSATILHLETNKDIWFPSKRKGYYFLKKEYKIPETVLFRHFKFEEDPELLYISTLLKALDSKYLAMLIYFYKYEKMPKIKNLDEKEIIRLLKNKKLIVKSKNKYVISNKGLDVLNKYFDIIDALDQIYIKRELLSK